MTPPTREVRAVFDDETITVYQAYPPSIAHPAVRAGRFVPPFKLDRMTWIKPSFLWMMYRSGWATKAGQERVLAVRITRAGFEQALAMACLSHFDPAVHHDRDAWQTLKATSPVRVQWDPERTPTGDPLPWRSLQVGLGGEAVHRYVEEWTVDITDLTRQVAQWRSSGAEDGELPPEKPYPVPATVAARIGVHTR